jgi:hypothetical protein
VGVAHQEQLRGDIAEEPPVGRVQILRLVHNGVIVAGPHGRRRGQRGNLSECEAPFLFEDQLESLEDLPQLGAR